MTTAYPTAHEAYRAAADLVPPRSTGREPIDAEWRWADQEVEVAWGDVIAVGGAMICLFAGAFLGDWLHVPL